MRARKKRLIPPAMSALKVKTQTAMWRRRVPIANASPLITAAPNASGSAVGQATASTLCEISQLRADTEPVAGSYW